MITIKNLSWSNWFSYGEDNYVGFDSSVLQVTGKNGVGKTSIPLILQELYYGKNCKGKKKTSLVNRHIPDCVLEASSDFEDGEGNIYNVSLTRKSTLKLVLTKNGLDISSHTATNTYKSIEDILGLDFKTFSQITYQSSTDGLDFLISTDSNRKKFLTGLFGLDVYTKLHDKFKTEHGIISKDIVKISSKINTIVNWIKKYEKEELIEVDMVDIPEVSHEDISTVSTLRSDIKNITETNKKINNNNTYIRLLDSIDTTFEKENLSINKDIKDELTSDANKHDKLMIKNKSLINVSKKSLSSLESLGDTCPNCMQEISAESKSIMMDETQYEIDILIKDIEESDSILQNINIELSNISSIEDKIKERNKKEEEISRLSNSIDNTLPSEVLVKDILSKEMNILIAKIEKVKKDILVLSDKNNKSSAHNERIKVIIEQLAEYTSDIVKEKESLKAIESTANSLDVLKKAFSPSGLLSYKIDFLVKDLENEINKYLGEFSGGKFQLRFTLASEKLNVEIIDNGNAIGIQEVSAGELARINASTLLAIRKLMSAISTTKVNVLFLDEILAVLDDEGRDSLIDVLHKEKDLNTIIVSHQWSHPLIPKINITKENKVSRIEE